MKHQCANTRCNNRVSRPGEYCATCARQQLPISLTKHDGERMTRGERLEVNNSHKRNEDK
ncbi:MAG: hypothetical protein EHM33_00785 [Chloroflexi bacterium]|nr:MAG: hypothetical protein EHM33_00785 [Chloroflexota bacterium]